ncbi:MAG TPA: hypothetical protein VFZ43_01725, partial [Anaerolineales bacterium]
FLHVLGALGFFIVLGVEWIALSKLRSAILAEKAHTIVEILKSTDRLGTVSMLTIVVTGFYMLLTVWGWVAWILVVLGALVLDTVLFIAFTRPRMAAIDQALAAEKGSLSQTFYNLVNHPILWISVQTRAAIVLGIILLKFSKPDWGGSLLTIAVALVLGLASALPVLGRERAQVGSAD